jgi:hypothetical protein
MIVFIEPVKGVREIADRVQIRVVNYELQKPEQTLYFKLMSQFNPMIEEGNLIIPEPIVAQWGVDDSFIVKWALETLGLEEKKIVPLEETLEEEVAPEIEGE